MGKPGTGRSAAGRAGGHGRLAWKVQECTRADPASDGFSSSTTTPKRLLLHTRQQQRCAKWKSGYQRQARADADAAMKLAPNRDVRAMAALALARAGDTARAEKLAAELDKAFPLDTLVQNYWLPTIRAAVALERKDPNLAIELLKMASTVELGQPAQVNVFLCPVYLRGEAYLMLHDGNAARMEFQKFIDHYGLVVNFPWGALARLGLGSRLRAVRRYHERNDCLPGLPCNLERRRSRYTHLPAGQSRVHHAVVDLQDRPWERFAIPAGIARGDCTFHSFRLWFQSDLVRKKKYVPTLRWSFFNRGAGTKAPNRLSLAVNFVT